MEQVLFELLQSSTAPSGNLLRFPQIVGKVRTILADDPTQLNAWETALRVWLAFVRDRPKVNLAVVLKFWKKLLGVVRLPNFGGDRELVKVLGERRPKDEDLARQGWPSYLLPEVRSQVIRDKHSNRIPYAGREGWGDIFMMNAVPYLARGKRLNEQARPVSVVTRSGFDGQAVREARDSVRYWTLGSEGIQAYMREGRDDKIGTWERKADHIMRYMRWQAPRTPQQPAAEKVQFLYRGIRGDTVAAMEATGYCEDRGFMAFTPRSQIGRHYARPNFPLLRLDVADIPANVPWIWYGSKDFIQDAWDESQVLLPPGRLTVVANPSVAIVQNMLPVRYEPAV